MPEHGDMDPATGVTDRREFLTKWGKFVAITPPAVTLMLTGASRGVVAASSGFRHRHRRGRGHSSHRGNGFGHHHFRHDGSDRES